MRKTEKKKKDEKKYRVLLSFSFIKGSSVNILLSNNKRSFFEAFCLTYIGSSNQKLEISR